MKKNWSAPVVQELTIQATAHGYGGNHYNGGYPSGRPGGDGRPGGNSNLCRCQGGTSPCSKHHGFGDFDDGEELS